MSEYIYETEGEPMVNESGVAFIAHEEILRCRDCMSHGIRDGLPWCDWSDRKVEPAGFCAWAVRRLP